MPLGSGFPQESADFVSNQGDECDGKVAYVCASDCHYYGYWGISEQTGINRDPASVQSPPGGCLIGVGLRVLSYLWEGGGLGFAANTVRYANAESVVRFCRACVVCVLPFVLSFFHPLSLWRFAGGGRVLRLVR